MARIDKRAAATHSTTAPSAAAPLGMLGALSASSRHLALLAATVATCGSLFFSEVLKWQPCELCWFQRILMYPLTVILLVGIVRGDRGVHLYALPLALLGMGVSLYHYLVTMLILPPPACSGGIPCAFDYLNFQGALSFVKVPFLAFVAFSIISVMLGNHMIDPAVADVTGRARTLARGAAVGIVAGTALIFLVLAAV